MRCVLYLRMSKDIQESSPGDQRKSLKEYAKEKGYEIVGEYLDEGVSGDATEKRSAFLTMIQDCRSKRFEIVLCWDQDRFGRFDPLEAGYWIKPMRDAGIVLETIAQGRVDWNDFAGRLVWSVNQEAKHAFLRDLARNSLRGNINRAKAGKFTGRAPFGYVVGESGSLELGDHAAVAAVRRAFELRKLRLGYRVIGLRLTKEGHPSPSGLAWSPDSVRIILNREIYTGTLVYGRCHRGKYSTTVNGVVGPSVGGVNKANQSPIRVENSHPPIVDLDTWKVVNSMHRDPPKPHANSGQSGAPLAGILKCGLCGAWMYSQSLQKASGQRNPNYICGSYMLGRGCGYCVVPQGKIHEIVAEHFKRSLGRSFDALTASIKSKISKIGEDAELESMKRKSKALDAKIRIAEKRLLIVNDRLFSSLQQQLLQMKDEQVELLEAIANYPEESSADPLQIAQELWRLADLFSSRDAAEVRSLVRSVVDHIRLDFKIGRKTGRGQSYDFLGCFFVYRQSTKPCASPATSTMFRRLIGDQPSRLPPSP